MAVRPDSNTLFHNKACMPLSSIKWIMAVMWHNSEKGSEARISYNVDEYNPLLLASLKNNGGGR